MDLLKHSYVEISVEELGSLGLLIAAPKLSKMHPEKMFLFMPATGSGARQSTFVPVVDAWWCVGN